MFSWRRGKSAGWAAFDLKHNPEKYEQQNEKEAFPPLSCTSVQFSKNSRNPSLLTTSVSSAEREGNKHSARNTEPGVNYHMNVLCPKSFHFRPGRILVADGVMDVIDNGDVTKTKTFPFEMISAEKKTKRFDPEFVDMSSTCEVSTSESNSDRDLCISFKEHCDLSKGIINVHENCDVSEMKNNTRLVGCVLSEPEWEEDDIYKIHRKHALRITRAASKHSRAAANAFLRGDHISSQLLSQKAKEEWTSSNRLNTEAAKNILRVRNKNNGQWKLDLHGLHVAEAVHALRERLLEIEESSSFNSSKNSKRDTTSLHVVESNIVRKHNESTCPGENYRSLINPRSHCVQRPTSLEVITGAGNHSKGPALLASAVRSYLSENSYRFDELRLGVFLVRPKFG